MTGFDPLTHAGQDGVVVFNIGMTIHQPWRLDVLAPVFTAMPRMLAELTRNREQAARGEAADLGFLSAETMFGPKGPWVVQYWRDVASLHGYAQSRDGQHLPAWRAFNQAARRHPGVVGIWHETFVVPADGIETFYRTGKPLGLGAAVGLQPLERRGRTAAERLGQPAG